MVAAPAKPAKTTKNPASSLESPHSDADVEVNEEDVSEQDIQAAMAAAIQEKKKQKFDKMIERGSKIAAQEQEQAVSQLVGNSISNQQPENSESNKVTRAVLETSTEVEKQQAAAPPPTEQEQKVVE